jgi:hypothetical protein
MGKPKGSACNADIPVQHVLVFLITVLLASVALPRKVGSAKAIDLFVSASSLTTYQKMFLTILTMWSNSFSEHAG